MTETRKLSIVSLIFKWTILISVSVPLLYIGPEEQNVVQDNEDESATPLRQGHVNKTEKSKCN